MTLEIERRSTYVGTFRPRVSEGSRGDLAPYVGTRAVFVAEWEIFGGLYDGEWAMISTDVDFFPAMWIPSGDLEALRRWSFG